MNPSKAENKDIINAKVKFREAFRPFCPSMLDEYAGQICINSRKERYMITSFDCKPEWREKIPAVVHVDGTLRPQTVEKKLNEKYWNLINEFYKLTGLPVVLNTSLNIKGEPIICEPGNAVRCFYDSGMDILVLGNYMLTKKRH